MTQSAEKSPDKAALPGKAVKLKSGTYRLFSRSSRGNLAVDIRYASRASGAPAILWPSTGDLNQRFYIQEVDGAYTLRAVSSGKYLTARRGSVVQMPCETRGGRQKAAQLWRISYANGYVFTNVATNEVLSVERAAGKKGSKLVTAAWSGKSNRTFKLKECAMIPDGLYTVANAAHGAAVLDVSYGSLASGANLLAWIRKGGNGQKFWFQSAGKGYYRIYTSLSDTVVSVEGASKKPGANVLMGRCRPGASSQLWKPEVANGGLVFVNKKSGKILSAMGEAVPGVNVRQAKRGNAVNQVWRLEKTALNVCDMASYLNAIALAPNGDLTVTNKVDGWEMSAADYESLCRAIRSCGFGIGFILTDCSTGTVISYHPDSTFYGASTIKALWVTYLFEEYLEKGRLSWGQISGLATPAIVVSSNSAYLSLRSSRGSESGFGAWLNDVGVGYIGRWGYYTPRTLHRAWVHMLSYSNSGKQHVGTWKSIFNHSYMSAIHDALGGYRTTYSKPGWMMPGGHSGAILNDSAVVVGAGGRQYLLTIMTHASPYSQKGRVQNVVQALDKIQASMPPRRR